MSTTTSLLRLLFCAALFLVGCSPQVGDSCNLSTDCSVQGDRLCDTTAPGGYCTLFNCEPDRCPEEASCVAFTQQPGEGCKDPQRWQRFQRTFCMRTCESNSDCREGYVCVGGAELDRNWNARVVDPDGGKRICVAAYSAPSTSSSAPAVCEAAANRPDLGSIPYSDLNGTSGGAGGSTTAGAGGSTTAGAGGSTTAGAGGSTTAGAGGSTTAGAGGSTTAGAGGSTTAGAGGSTTAGAGGSTTAGAGGSTTAGAGGG